MLRSLAAGLALVVIAGCSGDDEVDARRADTPLRYCDGSRVDVRYVSGDEAIDTWRDLREKAADSGRWPVVVGSPEDIEILAEAVRLNCKDGHGFEDTLREASNVDIAGALSRVARAYGVRERDLRGSTPLPDYPYSKDGFLVPIDFVTDEPFPEVGVAVLPIDEGWQATAILPFGNYNENPGPAIHAAVLRDWGRRYGAELVSMTGDVIEMSVSRPPTTDQQALALAREQFSYAPDIVQQGTENVETLAAAVKDAHAWYFWWD